MFIINFDSSTGFIPFLLDYFEKKEVGQLLDVIAIVDVVIPQGMTKSPEFAYNISDEFPLKISDRINRIIRIFWTDGHKGKG